MDRLLRVAALVASVLAAQPARGACVLCNCNQQVYEDSGECNRSCRAGLGCFTGICTPFRPGGDPTLMQSAYQTFIFENLSSCYGVTDQESDVYNCIAWSAGIDSKWVWSEVDGLYGDGDGLVEVRDFDAFYEFGGYTVARSCTQEPGKEKVALYGHPDATGRYEGGVRPTHAARQVQGSIPGGDWWESKEGNLKRVVHRLHELTGQNYGDVIRCYERPL